jgi:beta-fructofuranosidase
MDRSLFCAIVFSGHWLLAQTPEIHFAFNQTTGDQTCLESISSISYPVTNHFNKPEFISAIDGNALRLDGWSTYITSPTFSMANITRQLTIETWYATEAFTKEPASIFDWIGPSSGFHLSVGSFGEINFGYVIDGASYLHNTPNHLSKYQWHHIVAVINLDAGITKIYVDNALWFSKTDLLGTEISTSTQALFIGKRNLNQSFSGFSTNTLNGAIDDLVIYSTALDEATIAAHFTPAGDRTVELVIDPTVRYAGDYLRPQYHPIPNAVWANECYGLIYYNNKYHLFFQKNPNGPYLYFMHWGHFTSPDLVNWTEERIALAPDSSPGFDNFGVWSGTATLGIDGTPKLIYTGVNGQRAAIGLASPTDSNLTSWTKSSSNPIIPGAPSSYPTMDFRDTYIWKDGTTYYMIVGSGINGNGGGVVFNYKSNDLLNWTLIGPLYRDINTTRSGIFWEMPFFYKVSGNTYILGVNPVPTPSARTKTLYWLGKWENEKFTPYDVTPKQFEFVAENMLAPALGTDKDGNPVYIGIIPEDRSEASQIAAGWRQTFSLPRELRLLQDSTIGHLPHRNLCRLRGPNVVVQNRSIASGTNFNLPELAGTQTEFDFNIKADSASIFSIQVYKNLDGKEFTSLKFSLRENTISLDRSFSTYSSGLKNIRTENYIFDHKDTINIRMFLDHSILEVFVDRVIVISCRVYPSRIEDDKVDIILNEGGVNILSVNQWSMLSTGQSNNQEVCIPSNLPLELRKKKKSNPVTAIDNDKSDDHFDLYPIPSSGKIGLHKSGNWQSEFSIYSMTGQLVLSTQVSNFTNEIEAGHLPNGIYVAKSLCISKAQYFKIVIQH